MRVLGGDFGLRMRSSRVETSWGFAEFRVLWVSSFGFRVWGVRVSGFGFGGFEFRVSGLGCLDSELLASPRVLVWTWGVSGTLLVPLLPWVPTIAS